ncbi:MAG: hypothetical protein P1P85_04195 [Patescibacteria group bacterium]|nr:hypothetical protein [Patescibacteria group bacterium]
MSYIDKTQIEEYTGLTISSGLDGFMTTLIGSVEAYIEKYCGGRYFEKRWFNDSDIEKTFRYDGNDDTKLAIDDLRSLTSLTVDDMVLTENEDFHLYPLNAVNYGMPYEWIELIQPETRLLNVNSRLSSAPPYIFDKGQRTIVVVGKFGYSVAVPDDIKLVALKLVGSIIKENIRDSDLKEVTQESLGDYSASYTKIVEIANQLKINEILDKYKKKCIPNRSENIKIN